MANIKSLMLFFTIFALLNFGIFSFTLSDAQEDNFKNLFVELHFSPSVVSPGEKQHNVGFLNIVDEDGFPVLSPAAFTIKLLSSEPSIVSVPSEVVLPVNRDYIQFPVTITEAEGESEITAIFQGNEFVVPFRVGGISVDVPLNVNLEIGLPSKKMHVESTIPISVFLDNEGTILQAPKDIEVSFQYEESLITMDDDKLIIKKGDYYATTTLTSLKKTGFAFIRAITTEPPLDSFRDITITSSLPSRLQVNVWPESVIPLHDREIDIFVSLLDSEGNPVKATSDVKFEMYSNIVDLDEELNEQFRNLKPKIRVGEWGFYFKLDDIIFQSEEPRNFIGVLSDEFGLAEAQFSVVEVLDEDNIRAENKTLIMHFLPDMPPDATGILVYQVAALKGEEDDTEVIEALVDADIISEHSFDDDDFYEEGDKYPLDFNFDDFDANELSGRVVSSDRNFIKILDPGDVNPERGYGTAIIQSALQPVDGIRISATIKGVASETVLVNVVNPTSPTTTLIFSPTGSQIVFNDEGKANLFLIPLDAQSRPAEAIGEISYLLSPVNEKIEIKTGQSFFNVDITSSTFNQELQAGVANLTAYPIGIGLSSELLAFEVFDIAPASSTVDINIPVDRIVGFDKREHSFGTVQLSDFFGNPVTVTSDLKIEITSNDTEKIEHPNNVIISTGESYVHFPVITFGERGGVELYANARGFIGSTTILEYISFIKELVIFPTAPSLVKLGESVELQIFVDDENAIEVEGVLIELYPQVNSTVFPATIITDESGRATALFTNLDVNVPTSAIDIFASKSGFIEDRTTLTIELFVEPIKADETLFGVDPLILYGAIGGGVAAAAGMAAKLLRKPKVMTEEEFEEEEI